MYANGKGVPQDYKEAVRWYTKAAEQGDAQAQTNLGWMYEYGRGVPQDYKEAMRWYRLAAAQGHAQAQTNLGVMYANGQGVPQDYKEAMRWYTKAAEQGHNAAANERDRVALLLTSLKSREAKKQKDRPETPDAPKGVHARPEEVKATATEMKALLQEMVNEEMKAAAAETKALVQEMVNEEMKATAAETKHPDMITRDEKIAESLPDTSDALSAGGSSVDYVPSVLTRPKHNAYAVIIGIESYRDLPTVDFAQRDAATMKTYLIKAMGYQEEHIILLQNGDATRGDFIARFETWLPNHVDADSEVFVFYAGHGAPDPVSGQPYLVPYNGDPAYLKDTAYPIDRLYETLAKLPAKQVVVALDSCFSGLGGRSVIQKGVRPMMLTVEDPVLASDKLIVVSAAQGDQISTAFPKQQHGLFTYYFIKGLQGAADADDDGVVALDELFTYLQPQVTRQARRMNIDQEPSISPSLPLLRERGAIPLVTLSPEPF